MAFQQIFLHLTLSAIGVLFGVAEFICCVFVFYNYEAGVLGGYSAVLALFVFVLHYNRYRNDFAEYSTKSFEKYEVTGFIGMLLGIAIFIFFTVLEIYKKTAFYPLPGSNILKMISAFAVVLWGLLLFFFSNRYSKMTEDNVQIVTQENVE